MSSAKDQTVKKDDLSPAHLEWLVKSRTISQESALKLYQLFEDYPEKLKGKIFSQVAQQLTAVCFSLWRAAFLADNGV